MTTPNQPGGPASATGNRDIEQQHFFLPLNTLPTPPELKGVPGAKTRVMEGSQHGILGTSILIAEVEPGAGPPLHLHFTEEIQVVSEGQQIEFLIGEKQFMVNEPGIVHIPANTPHAFINRGEVTVKVVAFFPSSSYELNWKVLKANPFIS